LKITEVAQFFGLLFSTESLVLIFDKNGLGYILSSFFSYNKLVWSPWKDEKWIFLYFFVDLISLLVSISVRISGVITKAMMFLGQLERDKSICP
jgi:hypothetical protein